MKMMEDLIDANGVTGSRSRDVTRIRGGLQRISGQVIMEPTALEWASLIPWFMDGTSSGSGAITYILGKTAAVNYAEFDKVSKDFVYSGVAVNRATISGASGEPLRLTLDLIGLTESVNNAGTFPALSYDQTTAPFVFMDSGPSGITINSVTMTPKRWSFTIDNHIDANRFLNSLTMPVNLALDRTTTLTLEVPYDSVQAALYGAGASGVSASFDHTNGNQTLNILFPALTFPRQGQDIPGRQEIDYSITGTAYRASGGSATDSEVSIVSNPGP